MALPRSSLQWIIQHCQIVAADSHQHAPAFESAKFDLRSTHKVLARRDRLYALERFDLPDCLRGEQFLLAGAPSTAASTAGDVYAAASTAAPTPHGVGFFILGEYLDAGEIADAAELAGGAALHPARQRDQQHHGCGANEHPQGGEGNPSLAPVEIINNQADQVKKTHASPRFLTPAA